MQVDGKIVLKIYANREKMHLLDLYKNQIISHNQNVATDPYANSGFDLFIPGETFFNDPGLVKMINLEIKTEMVVYDKEGVPRPSAYYVYPRSSMSKTPLMLANHTGIIDSGYRGFLMGAFRWLRVDNQDSYMVKKHDRLLQICHPSLLPFFVEMVDENELSSTARGEGGFGSTG